MGWTVARALFSFFLLPSLSVALSAFHPLSSLPRGQTDKPGSLGSRTACWSDLAGLPNGELGIVPQFLSQQTYTHLLRPLFLGQ